MGEAKEVIRFCMLQAIAETAVETGLVADRCESLVDALFERVFGDATIWAVVEYLGENFGIRCIGEVGI